MPNLVEIENIEEMRRLVGIDDADLRMEIRALKVGDFVKLTFLSGASSFETLLVRITSIRGSTFRGKLAEKPSAARLRKLGPEAAVAFTTAHIHSLHKRAEVPG
jgi:hypothetical protein